MPFEEGISNPTNCQWNLFPPNAGKHNHKIASKWARHHHAYLFIVWDGQQIMRKKIEMAIIRSILVAWKIEIE